MSNPNDARDAALRTSIPVARYAEILAHVVHFGAGRKANVVERFGYSLEAWRELDHAWNNGIAAGTSLEQPAQILAFSATFHQHRLRLAEQKPTLESIAIQQVTNRRPPEPSLPTTPTQSSGVPTFMLAEAARAAAPPTPAGASPWAAYATPHVEPPMAPTNQAPLPAPVPVQPLSAKSPTEPLPFVQGIAAEIALQSAVEHAQKVQGSTSPAPAASLGSTKALEDNDISAIARRVVPFGGSSIQTDARPARDPELTLEQHAALYIELELYPGRKAEILQRYGLTPSQHARIDAGWDAQLTLNHKLAAAWQQAAEKHRTRLLGGA